MFNHVQKYKLCPRPHKYAHQSYKKHMKGLLYISKPYLLLNPQVPDNDLSPSLC